MIWLWVYTILFGLEVGFLVASIVLFKILIDHQQLSWVLVSWFMLTYALFTFLAKYENNLQRIYDFFLGYSTIFFIYFFPNNSSTKGWIRIQNANLKVIEPCTNAHYVATSSLTHLLWNLLNSYHYLHRTWQIEDVNN